MHAVNRVGNLGYTDQDTANSTVGHYQYSYTECMELRAVLQVGGPLLHCF